jgi:polar amino acid transport system substrate-binding protein
VRDADVSRFSQCGGSARAAGRYAGGGTIAYDILLRAERDFGIHAVSYDDDVHPYTDLVIGRVDAVLLDNVLAERRRLTTPGFAIQPESVAIGHYVGVLAPHNALLRDSIDVIRRDAMRDGTLERIFRKWRVWNDDQPALYADVLAGRPVAPIAEMETGDGPTRMLSGWEAAWRYMPSLLRASLITLVLSGLSMALAVAFGVFIASGRFTAASSRARCWPAMWKSSAARRFCCSCSFSTTASPRPCACRHLLRRFSVSAQLCGL